MDAETGALVQVVCAVATVAVTGLLVWLTSRYVTLIRDLVEEARASKVPTVFADIELSSSACKFVIGNAGTSPALDVTIEVLRDAQWRSLANDFPVGLLSLSPVKRGIPYMAPGCILKFLPGAIGREFFADDSRIELRLSYTTETRRRVSTEITFDLAAYNGIALESFQDQVAHAINRAGLLQSMRD